MNELEKLQEILKSKNKTIKKQIKKMWEGWTIHQCVQSRLGYPKGTSHQNTHIYGCLM